MVSQYGKLVATQSEINDDGYVLFFMVTAADGGSKHSKYWKYGGDQ